MIYTILELADTILIRKASQIINLTKNGELISIVPNILSDITPEQVIVKLIMQQKLLN